MHRDKRSFRVSRTIVRLAGVSLCGPVLSWELPGHVGARGATHSKEGLTRMTNSTRVSTWLRILATGATITLCAPAAMHVWQAPVAEAASNNPAKIITLLSGTAATGKAVYDPRPLENDLTVTVRTVPALFGQTLSVSIGGTALGEVTIDALLGTGRLVVPGPFAIAGQSVEMRTTAAVGTFAAGDLVLSGSF